MRAFLLGFFICVVAVSTAGDHAASAADRGGQFQNLDRMIEGLNLRPYFNRGERPRQKLKVAIFDNGFRGARAEIGKSLPANTQIHNGSVALPGEPDSEEVHGFYMARIFWSLLSNGETDERYSPAEFHLYQTFGYTNLKEATEDAIRRRMDIVVYSQTWEYGGNFDGRGFINAVIDRAIDAGILWINNSGNFGDTTYNSGITSVADDWVDLPGRNESVEIRCAENPNKKCQLRSVLSWNDFADDVEQGTDKDLDFVLTDDTLNIVQSSNLQQKKDAKDEPGTSKYPREILTAELKPGLYFLRVKNRSKNFGARDRLRITAGGDFVSMAEADKEESLLPPADNPRAITVGALDSEKSSVSRRLKKPELLTNSLVSLSREENFKGSSNSAAMVAAGAAILLSRNPSLTREKILSLTTRTESPNPPRENEPRDQGQGRGLPLEQLGFAPTGNRCFRPLPPSRQPDFVKRILAKGGTLVDTNAGAKIFYPYDPIRLLPGITRRQANDMLVYSTQGAGIFHRSGLWDMPETMIELVQTPRGQIICGQTSDPTNPGPANPTPPTWGRVFRLPSR